MSSAIGAVELMLGVTMIIAWAARGELPRSVVQGSGALLPSAAPCFLLTGIALLALQRGARFRSTARFAAALAAGIAEIAVVAYGLGLDARAVDAGLMAPSAAWGFLLAGVAMLAISMKSDSAARLAQLAAILASILGLLRLMSLGTGGHVYVAVLSADVALHTAAGMVLLGVGILLAAPEAGFMAVVVSEGPGGSAFRRLAIPAAAAPVLVLLAAMAGIHGELFDTHYALAFSLTTLIPAAFVCMWRCARDEERIDEQRRLAERQLAASEARLKSLSDCSPVGVFLTDAAGLCTYTNARWGQISGLNAEESLNEGWRQAIHHDDLERVSREWLSATASGCEFASEFRFVLPSADVRWVQTSAAPLEEPQGTIAGYVGTTVDMTERREIEQLRTDLVSMLSHDLRNPLTVIIGFTEHLLDTLRIDEADKNVLQRIEANAKTAITLASNFVDAMRIEAGKLEVRRQQLPLADTVRSVVESEATLAKMRGVTIETVESGEVPDMFVDGGLLERAVGNLVSNAVKFSPAGGRVQVSVKGSEGLARIAVSDEGPGVDTSDQPKLFQRFSALSGSKPDSTGLGLFIVRTIAEAHGGSVEFSAAPGGGATFTIALPIG